MNATIHAGLATLLSVGWILLSVTDSPAQASDNTTWINPGHGDWFNANNWDAGTPSILVGATIGNGGTAHIWGGSAEAHKLRLGYDSSSPAGSLEISSGGDLSTYFVLLGYEEHTQGTATIAGNDSTWHAGDVYVGYRGTGNFEVKDGASVTSSHLRLGYFPGAWGQLTITGPGSLWKAMWTSEARIARGRLNIEAGGQLFSGSGHVTTGVVTIAGAGSKWNCDWRFYINAWEDPAVVRIEEGGRISTFKTFITSTAPAMAEVVINGSGSALEASEALEVGSRGRARVTLADGGMAISHDVFYVFHTQDGLGEIYFDNGTLSSESLFADSAAFIGTGTVYTHGLLLDGFDVVFDRNHPPQQVFTLNQLPGQNVALHVDLSSPPESETIWTLGAGFMETGTLTIADGQCVYSSNGILGMNPDSFGTARVTGDGSEWRPTSSMYVGEKGTGVLDIDNGGCVTTKWTYLGYESDSQGTLRVSGAGSKYVTQSISVGRYGTGTAYVLDGGRIESSNARISGSRSKATLAGQESAWSNTGTLSVVNGALYILDGAHLDTKETYISELTRFKKCVVSVSGTGSRLTNSENLYIGNDSTYGRLQVKAGAYFSNADGVLGNADVTVADSGSEWNNSGTLYIGKKGKVSIAILDGASFFTKNAYIGYSGYYKSGVVVSGPDSTWVNTQNLYVGHDGTGILAISNGGKVTSPHISINNSSRLAIEVGRQSTLTVDGGSGTITNHGTVCLLAGAGLEAGEAYQPIRAGMWEGTGTYQAIGGTWNHQTHTFTVSSVQTGTAGAPLYFDLAQTQRTLITDPRSGCTLGVSLPAGETSRSIAFMAEPVSGDLLSSLQAKLPEHHQILGAWTLGADAFSPTNNEPMFLSFKLDNPALKTSDVALWYYYYGKWEPVPAYQFTCDGRYAMALITTGTPPPGGTMLLGSGPPGEPYAFGAYAVSAVPEAGALALLLAAAFAGVVWQWWRARANEAQAGRSP